MTSEGRGHGSGSNLHEDPDLLRGVLATDAGTAVYPEDYCLLCEREGKLHADEQCFHRHWRVADEAGVAELR